MNELFWTASETERDAGYRMVEGHYQCLLCDHSIEAGYIFPKGDLFITAEKAMGFHIEEVHGGVLNYLTNLDKKMTGLSDHQSKIIQLFYQGMSDQEVQKTLKIGSISTVRNHRYALKEKEKQAKTMSTVMSLLARVGDDKKQMVQPHKTATMVDDRYKTTVDEQEKALETYFPEGPDGQLTTFYVKEKNKLVILSAIIKKFEEVRRYTEKEVDTILKKIYPEDHVMIRRYLIQYGFMDREKDCSIYWVKDNEKVNEKKVKEKKVEAIDKSDKKRKKALAKEYKAKVASEDIESGVYQVRNMLNGKVYIGSSRNIKKLEGLTFQLNNHSFVNSALQADWIALGKENFAIEVLESFVEDDNSMKTSKVIREMEQKWKEKIQPYGDKGYHRMARR